MTTRAEFLRDFAANIDQRGTKDTSEMWSMEKNRQPSKQSRPKHPHFTTRCRSCIMTFEFEYQYFSHLNWDPECKKAWPEYVCKKCFWSFTDVENIYTHDTVGCFSKIDKMTSDQVSSQYLLQCIP